MRRSVGRLRLCLGAVALISATFLVAMAVPGGAHAALVWSRPHTIDPNTSGLGVLGVACPSTRQCTLVDGQQGHAFFKPGVEVTFNPRAPGSPKPVTIDNQEDGFEASVACPSLTQCTTVSPSEEVTFNPRSPGSPKPVTIDSGFGLDSVACPSLGQCTAVGLKGQEVTFDPRSPGGASRVKVDSNRLDSVACPSTTQCTAVGVDHSLVTFNPQAPGSRAARTLKGYVRRVACPSVRQCTAVGFGPNASGRYVAQETTFNPRSPGSPAAGAIAPGRNPVDVACPSVGFCAAVDATGEVLEGNPTAPKSFKRIPLPGYEEFTGSGVIACASVAQCVAVDWDDNAYVGAPDNKVTIKIKGKRIKLHKRRARVKLACPKSEASPPCAGKLALRTAKKVPFHGHKRHVALAKASFKIGAGKTKRVKLALAKPKAKLVAHKHKARKVRATARVHDAAGNHAKVSKALKLKP